MEDFELCGPIGCIEVYLRSYFSIRDLLFSYFTNLETIPNLLNSCPKAWSLSSKNRTSPAEDIYISVVVNWSWRSISAGVATKIAVSIGKTMYATTVWRRLHMNGLYVRLPCVEFPLSVQFRGTWLHWCCLHVNWSVSYWGNVMLTNESIFAL